VLAVPTIHSGKDIRAETTLRSISWTGALKILDRSLPWGSSSIPRSYIFPS